MPLVWNTGVDFNAAPLAAWCAGPALGARCRAGGRHPPRRHRSWSPSSTPVGRTSPSSDSMWIWQDVDTGSGTPTVTRTSSG